MSKIEFTQRIATDPLPSSISEPLLICVRLFFLLFAECIFVVIYLWNPRVMGVESEICKNAEKVKPCRL